MLEDSVGSWSVQIYRLVLFALSLQDIIQLATGKEFPGLTAELSVPPQFSALGVSRSSEQESVLTAVEAVWYWQSRFDKYGSRATVHM